MLETFLKYLQYEKRYSRLTVIAYEHDLSSLEHFSKEVFDSSLLELTPSILRSWMVDLAEKEFSSKTVVKKMSAVRSFCKFLIKNGYLSTNPTVGLRLPKIREKLPNFIQETALQKLLDNTDFKSSFEDKRDQLILELFYGTGVRLSELIEMKESDIDFYNQCLIVLGKGNKERLIPIYSSLLEIIRNYMSYKHREVGSSPYLFVTNKNKKMYPMIIYRIVKKYLSTIEASKKKSPHVLRHTFATHLLNKGADLNAIKELMGHKSLAATQVYAHNSLEKLKKVFDQSHPKA